MSSNLSIYFLDSKFHDFHEENFVYKCRWDPQNEHIKVLTGLSLKLENSRLNSTILFFHETQTQKSQIFHEPYLDLYKHARKLFWHNKELHRWIIYLQNFKQTMKIRFLKMLQAFFSSFSLAFSSCLAHSLSSLRGWMKIWPRRRPKSQHLLSCINY